MNGHEPSDDPRLPALPAGGDDPLAAWDEQRLRCPVAHDGEGAWSVYGKPEVRTVLRSHETFSNRVSGHISVPNGMNCPSTAATGGSSIGTSRQSRCAPSSRPAAAWAMS